MAILQDFDVSKFYIYNGSNLYLNKKAFVFNIYLEPDGFEANYYKTTVYREFPVLSGRNPSTVIDLFCSTLMQVMKLNLNICVNEYSINTDGEEYVVAVEFFDEHLTEKCVYIVCKWFKMMNDKLEMNFQNLWEELQNDFKHTIYGEPILYSLVEAGIKRNIPVLFLEEEGTFQWGYGNKQLRGNSGSFHSDSKNDNELLSDKAKVNSFLNLCGLPVPKGKICFTVEEAMEEAAKTGFPVVVKPVVKKKGDKAVTDIVSMEAVKNAFGDFIACFGKNDSHFKGIFVQKQITGNNYRMLTVNGKLASALLYVNSGESYGKPSGTVINVTDNIHPENKEMIEAFAGFFNIICLEFHVVSADISKQRDGENFVIINISAESNMLTHIRHAGKNQVDIAGLILDYHFGNAESSRIPIIAGNNISQKTAGLIYKKLKSYRSSVYFASLTEEGVSFNGNYFCRNENHDQNVKIILRNPKTEFAVFSHGNHEITDFGFFHEGADVVILDNANATEESIKNILSENGILIEISEHQITLTKNGEYVSNITYFNENDKDKLIMTALEPLLKEIMAI